MSRRTLISSGAVAAVVIVAALLIVAGQWRAGAPPAPGKSRSSAHVVPGSGNTVASMLANQFAHAVVGPPTAPGN